MFNEIALDPAKIAALPADLAETAVGLGVELPVTILEGVGGGVEAVIEEVLPVGEGEGPLSVLEEALPDIEGDSPLSILEEVLPLPTPDPAPAPEAAPAPEPEPEGLPDPVGAIRDLMN